jgi:hypothetical protein
VAITYPRDLPGPSSDIALMTITAENVVGISESPFTFDQQVHQHQGQVWRMTCELNPLARISAEPWIAWLQSLNGRYGTFLMGDPSGTTPRGSAGGSPKLSTGSATGLTVPIYAASSGTTNWLRAGDYIQIGTGADSRLHRNLQDVNTTSGGVATLDIWPRLRTTPASGSAVVVSSTVGVWRLMDNAAVWTVTGPGIYRIAFSAQEALP